MSLNSKKTIKVMEKALRLISKLSEEEIDNIVNGNIEFKISKVNKTIKKIASKKAIDDWNKEKEVLNNMNTREVAKKYLLNLKLTNSKLIDLGKALSISIAFKTKKEEMINRIVESTVGNRLKIDALKNGMI